MKTKNVLKEIVDRGKCRENCSACPLWQDCIKAGPGKDYHDSVRLIVNRAKEKLDKIERLEYLESLKA
jgi:uncharacterized protein (UPF0179 family)